MSTTKTTRTFVLHNDFHGTECKVRVPADDAAIDPEDGTLLVIPLSPGQVRKAHRSLCGISDCKCRGLHRNHRVDPIGFEWQRNGYYVSVNPQNEV